MQFLKSTVADYQLRTKISRAIADVTSNQRLTLKLADCDDVIPFAEEHPKIVLHYLHERLSGTSHTAAYLSVLLLDILVNTCSYVFHEVLASEKALQQRLVALASERAESDSQRKVRSAARNVVLDFSRTFFDDSRLVSLSLLAEQVERKTGKKLLRSIQIERTNVRVIDPRPGDIIMISPIKRGPTGRPLPVSVSGGSGGNDVSTVLHVGASSSPTTASSPTMSKFWICERCTFVNSNSLEKCNACGCKRTLFDAAVISSPTTTHPPSHHKQSGNVHPASSFPIVADGGVVADEPNSSSHVDPTESVTATPADSRNDEAKRVADEAEAKRLADEAEAEVKRLADEAEAEVKRLADEAEAKRLADEAEAKRLADEAEAEAKRVADEAEAKRLADEAEAKRVADEAEAEVKRLADEAEAKRVADEAEAEVKRLADEAEAKRLADEAEAKRVADEAEAKRLADEAEAKRLADEAEAEAKRVADEAEAEAKRVADVGEAEATCGEVEAEGEVQGHSDNAEAESLGAAVATQDEDCDNDKPVTPTTAAGGTASRGGAAGKRGGKKHR
jgi:hypothetical protein